MSGDHLLEVDLVADSLLSEAFRFAMHQAADEHLPTHPDPVDGCEWCDGRLAIEEVERQRRSRMQ
jgi:hypothetical protein